MHDIARYIDAQINLSTYEWGEVTQDEPIVRGDCNVLRISLDGEPPENALIYVRFINLLTHDSYGEISRTLTDGMEIDVPQNKELFSSPGQIGAAFSIETETCRESCTYPIKISIIPLCCGNEYVGETGVVLIEDVYAAGEAAEEAAENANTAAAELRQAAINGDFDGQDGAPGQPGADGFSPTVTVTQTPTGARISATDKDGTTIADISNGAPGQPGQPGTPGADGFSPVITVTDIEGGHRVTITDAQGTQYFDVLDGEGGGGAVSPTITVQDITGGHRLIITDVDGTKTVDVMDGAKGDKGDTGNGIASAVLNADYTLTLAFTDGTSYTTPPIRGVTGAPGADGFSPEASVTQTAYGAVIAVTDADGTTTANIYNGQNGAPGDAAGFGTPTATVDANVGTPSVEIAASGENTAKIFSFAFHNLKGENGRDGNKTYICTNFDATKTCAVGDYVMYSSVLYECTTAHTGAWNSSHFTAVTLNEGDLICNTDENSSVAWSDITGKPTIPTVVSQLTNDSGYQTAAQVTAAINSALGVIENGSY